MNTATKTNSLPSLLNDFVNLGFEKVFNDSFGTPNLLATSPVNITETDDAYQLDMVAPGRNKEDFTVSLDKNLLTIKYVKKQETTEEKKRTIRKEYSFQSFERTFTLNEQVDAAKISATYVDGVLKVVVPKKEVVKLEPTTITIN